MSTMRDYFRYGGVQPGAQGITAAQRQEAAAGDAAAASMQNAQTGADASMHNANVAADAARFGAAQATTRQGMDDRTKLAMTDKTAQAALERQNAQDLAAERRTRIAGSYGLQEVDRRGKYGLEAEHVQGDYGLQALDRKLAAEGYAPPPPGGFVSPGDGKGQDGPSAAGGYGLPAAASGQPQASASSPAGGDKVAAGAIVGGAVTGAAIGGGLPDETTAVPPPMDQGPSLSDRLRAGGGAMQNFMGETARTPLFQALAPAGVRLAAQAPVSGFGLPDVAPGAQASTDRAIDTIQSRSAAGKIPNFTERLGGLVARGARYMVTPQDDEESRRVASR